jgi:hypothetical protein
MEEVVPTSGPITTLVYPSISHAEFGRLLQKYVYDAEPVTENERIGYRTLSQPRFTAWMQTPFQPRPGEFAAIFLCDRLHLTPGLAANVVQALRGKLMYAQLDVNRHGCLAASHVLVVGGGITEYYLRNQLWHWKSDLTTMRDEIRKQARRILGQTVH